MQDLCLKGEILYSNKVYTAVTNFYPELTALQAVIWHNNTIQLPSPPPPSPQPTQQLTTYFRTSFSVLFTPDQTHYSL